MNPNYSGRNELPDNLKVLFRPFSMLIPDYQYICQSLLFSDGFKDAKSLGKKLVLLF